MDKSSIWDPVSRVSQVNRICHQLTVEITFDKKGRHCK
jgi:hypothetical protein